jgi:molybdopterin synthase sulfur carrier subunit
MVRIVLPHHLRVLACVGREVVLQLPGPATIGAVIDALESVYPMLGGTIREYGTGRRRPLVRFFACGEDVSHMAFDTVLPSEVAAGTEPLMILGAIAGG